MAIPLKMKKQAGHLFLYISAILLFVGFGQAGSGTGEPMTEDQHALDIGRAVLRLDELAGAGAAPMSADQEAELEKNVKFLSETKAGRMTWAWLEFRLKADGQLRLEGNPAAEAIKQRLNLFRMLLRKYFVLE